MRVAPHTKTTVIVGRRGNKMKSSLAVPAISLCSRLLGNPWQEFEDLLPTGLSFALEGHDPFMQPDDGISF